MYTCFSNRFRLNSPLAQITKAKTLGNRVETLNLGRHRSGLEILLHSPEQLVGSRAFVDRLWALDRTKFGLQFVRSWNMFAISALCIAPFILSLIFCAVWIPVFITKGADAQATVATAFTVASYMVTAGK